MLQNLSIRDFVIVDRLDLEFEPGFTALTGETGAGKSILVDALSMVLGERADAVSVREGAARAEVIAEFECAGVAGLDKWPAQHEGAGAVGVRDGAGRAEILAEFGCAGVAGLDRWLAQTGLAGGDEGLIARRIIEPGGRTRAFLNGRPVTLAQLREAGEFLVDIHGQ